MTDSEKKFLETNFKANEFASITILVKLSDLEPFIEHLKESNLTLAVLPSVQTKIDFETLNDTLPN